MDEELEQRGVTAKSFFDQATETREMVQTVQKTSNSNLSLLNELKERVRKIEVKLFDEEDRRQKDEMEAKVKEQNEKSQGSGGGNKEGGEEGGGTKGGGGGGVMGFISSFIGGLVGGTVGLAIQGAGAIIGLGTGIIKKGADLAKSLRKGFSNLFGGKKNEEGGEVKPKVNPNSLMDLKVEDKNVRGTGAKNRGREGGNFSGDQQRNERGEYASKNKNEVTKNKVVKEESFSIPEGKKTSFAEALSGDRDTIHQFLYEQRLSSAPPGEAFNDFSGNPAYDSDVDTFLRGLENNPKGIGIEISSGRVYLSKEKASDGGYTIGRENLPLDKLQESDNAMYGDTFPKGSFSAPKKNTYERAILEFNEGGVVQKFDQGGKVDSVPAMLTPGEFVVTKDAVQKVGVDTLKGLNASVGDTSKPELSSLEIGFGGGDMSLFEKKQTSVGGLDSSFMIDGEKQYLTPSQIKKQLTKMNVPYKELLNGMVIPDAAKMTADKMPEYYQKMKTVITETVPDKKMREKMVGELDKFMTNLAGGGDFRDTSQIEAEMNRYIPGTIENLGLQIGDEAKSKYNKSKRNQGFGNVTQNFNQGGLVQPVIESKNESGEMELIKNLSQSVDTNRQTLMVMEEQNQATNVPDQNPNPVALADAPQTAPAELQDTEAPIPFASLLRQSAQRYLNLSNNAMVIS